ncbi:DNA repair protein RecN [hydrothermal vent metagenome]|uniref:DNA repair protein RecN n=1 Tax=hydrothermal vent metagenome TaxID=652676 RepID=A0A1W1E831_9ZZZZ
MVERLYIRNLVTFKEAELSFTPGLVVFSGPSGAGKSVLISAILSSFGYVTKGAAALCELNLKRPARLTHEAYALEENLSIKSLKKEKLRYFIDGQSISRKILSNLFAPYVHYLSVRDQRGLDSETLLALIDRSLEAKEKRFKKLRKEYRKRYTTYRQKLAQLEAIRQSEKEMADKVAFLRYEIEKIEAADPKPGEEEALLRVKQQLSRIDKLRDALGEASEIFRFESSVEEVYRLLDKDATVFTEAMNQLRADFEESEMLADELEEVDVEAVLDRLGVLSELKRRYGSVEEALAYKEEKQKELDGYTHIEQDKSLLEQYIQIESGELAVLATKLSWARQQEAKAIEKICEGYLSSLKLPPLFFAFSRTSMGEKGMDFVDVTLGESGMETLSGGEFNRVRLALLAAGMPQNGKTEGVLILDEIDANVSGDESIAIADMIATLAQGYQVFAISHQPHLAAKASQHIVVEKKEGISSVRILDEEGRIAEIARIVAGEKPNAQAVAFATKLRADTRG